MRNHRRSRKQYRTPLLAPAGASTEFVRFRKRGLFTPRSPPPPGMVRRWTAPRTGMTPEFNPCAVVDLLLVYEPVIEVYLGYEPQLDLLLTCEDAMPPEQTLRLIRSQDLTLQATMTPPRDLTGWSITFQVRDSLGGTSRIAKTVGAGITVSDAGKGVLSIALAKADTSSLTPGSFVWDIKRTSTGANVVLARGELILEQEVTT